MGDRTQRVKSGGRVESDGLKEWIVDIAHLPFQELWLIDSAKGSGREAYGQGIENDFE